MFLKRLKKTNSLTIIFFIVFAIIFWSLPILTNTLSETYSHSFFPAAIIFILGLTIPLLQSIGLNNLIYEKDIIKKSGLVLAPVFLFLSTPFIVHPDSWIVSFFLLFYFNTLFSTFQKERPFKQSFNAHFLLATIGLFYSDILLLSPLIILVLLIFSNMSWRCLVISLIGLTLPFIFYWAYTFFLEIPFLFNPPTCKFIFSFSPNLKIITTAEISWYITVTAILIFSIFEFMFWIYKKSIRSRKSFFIIFAYFGFLLFIKVDEGYYLAVTPISIVVANFFVYSKRKKLAEFLFLLFILSSIYYRVSV